MKWYTKQELGTMTPEELINVFETAVLDVVFEEAKPDSFDSDDPVEPSATSVNCDNIRDELIQRLNARRDAE